MKPEATGDLFIHNETSMTAPENDSQAAVPTGALLPADEEDLINTPQPEKLKKRFRRSPSKEGNGPLILAFVAPVLIMIAIFVEREIFPFGSDSFLRTDMYHQYAPFFANMKDRIASGGSLLYGWDIGMGVNFTALYAYYLASPLNWLMILVPRKYIIEFMTYSIVFKIGLSGLSFSYYLKRHCNTNKYGIAFFGIFYALSGYMAAYSWNIMWLDCILLFPLILLGLERLVKEDKCYLYCITLGISILSNYYISIMICIYMVLYFIALIIIEKQYSHILKKSLNFAIYSLLAGGLSAIVLLPEIFALNATASGSFSFPKTYTSYFSIFDMIARHMPNVPVEIGLNHWPNIYCGVAVLLFFPLYLVTKKIPLRKRAASCVLLFIFYASFSTNVLNFIWHGFHYPNSLPCRQSFIYIALLLLMCFEAYHHLDSIKLRQVGASFWGATAFILLAEKFNGLKTDDALHFSTFYLSVLLLALYVGLLWLHKQRKMEKSLLIIFTATLVCVEAAMNTSVTSITTTSRTSYMRQYEPIQELLASIESEKEDFYRVEKLDKRTKNDGAWYGYASPSIFSSTANANLTSLYKKFGLEGSTNAYSFQGGTPFIASLLSIRYYLNEFYLPETELMGMVAEQDDIYLYENYYTLPLAFGIDRSISTDWSLSSSDPALLQNNLSNLLVHRNMLIETESETDGNVLTVYPEESGYHFVYVQNKSIETVNGILSDTNKKYSNVNRGYLLDLGYCYAGDEIILTADEKGQTFEAYAYRFSDDVFIEVYHELGKNPMTITSFSDTLITGEVTIDMAGYLFTTIPYEKGWTVKIDGIKISTTSFDNTFLMVPISAGYHEVEFSYVPDGFHLGIALTALSAAILIMMDILRKMKKRKELQEEFPPETFAFGEREAVITDDKESSIEESSIEESPEDSVKNTIQDEER